MKKMLVLQLLAFCTASVIAQDAFVFRGTVKCYIENDARATRGARNVVVVPGFAPAKSGMTGTQGYYELNTAASLQKLEGKYVMLYFVSSCRDCEIKKNVFVSDDQLRQAGRSLPSLTVETIQMRAPCKAAELKPLQSDSIYNVFAKLPPQDLESVAAYNVVAATPGLLNVLTNVITVAAVGGGDSDVDPRVIYPGRIRYGNFLFASSMNLSGNTGFNFSPVRDFSEAVFWNAAALTNSPQNGGVHFFSNFKNNHKATAYARLFDKLWLGAGLLFTRQDEFRPTEYRALFNPVDHRRRLDEYAVFLSPSYKFNNSISAGVSVKSIWQKFNRPARALVITDANGDLQANRFLDSTQSTQDFDADVSVQYAPTRSLKIGLTLMNLAGTELAADSYPIGRTDVPVQQLRSVGLGLTYRWKQFNFGTDVLVTKDELYDVSVGVNYIPLNNVLLSGGYAFRQSSFSLGLRIKYFRLTYIKTNDLLVAEGREGKSGILNGQIHSGLSLSF